MTRRPFLRVALAACLAAASFASHAHDWPSKKVITLVVPLAAGGSTDSTARLLADKLGKELGQQVIVENRVGAGGNIGAAYVAKSAPDGYTLLMATSTIATNVTLYKNMGFDLRKDLVPVSQVAMIPNVLTVNNTMPARTLQEFVEYVRQKKGPVTYGSAGNGTASHLSGALFNSMAHGEMLHVPYKGGAPANADLMGGQIQVVFSPMVEVLPFIDSGKLRALGVTTKNRSARLPNLPAVTEVLPGFDVTLWNGVFAPAGTPPAVVDKLAATIQKLTQDPALRKNLADQGSTPVASTPAEFRKVLDQEIDKWGKLVKLSGARVE
ncbi:tripartite tricarboxylate transporter substrate binding protein [Cupriavidus sp. BIC8F]|uniref:tripartite tricarboxylate transporter substrate binding protein n=1 Tax=Cupriavidus sp. BIC8F TaxID=3079014 RepID=UPI0029162996|nr:tripartite tricarboxylate transporter substrate binding protein [Cupriavidus sp. BIC8F]